MPKKPATTLPDFTPVPRQRMRRGGWSEARQREFIQTLAETGSVRAACRQMGVGEHHIYKLRLHPDAASFRAAWEAALDIGIARIEDLAMDRALYGVEEPVYHRGEIIGTRIVYDNRLLMFMLRNRAPRRFTDGQARGFSAIDRHALTRLKKDWRREWEAERAAAAQTQQANIHASLALKIEQMRAREESIRLMFLENGRDKTANDPGDHDETYDHEALPENLRRIRPKDIRRTAEPHDYPRLFRVDGGVD